jgi:hydroxymethylpyrimidine/phosphomethylpyrimidine kinase
VCRHSEVKNYSCQPFSAAREQVRRVSFSESPGFRHFPRSRVSPFPSYDFLRIRLENRAFPYPGTPAACILHLAQEAFVGESPPVVLTIAGFDPSAGAGIAADIKTIAAHGCYGVACITAMTVQSTSAVRRVVPLEASLVSETLEELAADFEIAAVHIGMLGSGGVAHAVADFLANSRVQISNVVLDPVLKSSSGAALLDAKGAKTLTEKLLMLADVVTPNVDEAATLTGFEVQDMDGMKAAALKLHDMGARAVVITGGHLDKAIDLLSFQTKSGVQHEVFRAERLQSNSTHGTGCAFSTAIACHLALNRGLAEATLLAKTYVSAAIASAQPLGRGIGPVHHLYRREQRRRAVASGDET